MSKVCHLCMEQQRLGDPQADKVYTRKNPFSAIRHFQLLLMRRYISISFPCWFVSADVFLLYFQMRVRKIAPKILQLLTEWTETFPYDFRDERMMRSLKELTHRLASGDEVSAFLFFIFLNLHHASHFRCTTQKLLILN